MRRIAVWLLDRAEKLYLHVHGWKHTGPNEWDSPKDHEKRHVAITQTHAINSCRYWHAQRRRTLRLMKGGFLKERKP
jgi:hypothetical protein